ncbi:tRNA (5-methylaminomethyl-2-thiouridine)(34)-methyltransferase MnmD [Mucilaginibacter rubeus]|uniref:tRNA (5-methylaminomethyl-2-thiouridine)(34)-methyltransferase MnmD n=1 Tax=Mucilaginibacter rubeus TaxID=2027860 RepID=A0AAE6MG92_9SPHI|nr:MULTISPECIES: tRNA (5-methylaminomethyl-2-thiouridine)(34)-methyltransferase MnmD [Mucilaginibacter]QEM02223.1 tRNA (5-methylaminomethyl-2-thiouridine)(34)-methyltransferase MnmD [Mucilaginibacter rubeus]QEM14849.1 tRNA (5-methylaminomethyl-2-thiouridine)(34)-methyltransferase MnmD [Mucilaginibacter gossypii]QTE42439.1 tRNA (5-methylaminomethyl-2-thiouridine)(34)-methyltransferase MnmD [Mucilaginibacter rubeus]QTE49042.1 tRNA (5-methylaminomethyl-2-thiouridine)(34)-methyltransferase MnmD [Mu
MNHELTIVPTADGSNTIYNAEVGEHYHSRHGALQESLHVFVKSGLQYFLERNNTSGVSILEVGFGTGLNFLLTADACTGTQIKLDYTGIEAYPVSAEMMAQTGYQQYIPGLLWEQFNNNYSAALTDRVQIDATNQLCIAHSKLLDFNTDEQFDIIYFDAFAAAHQPEMWDEEAISHTVSFLKPGGVFVTYAITGNLKRMLKSQGFKIEKAPGAPGKREMLRAVKL